VLGEGSPPAPRRTALEEILSGQLDGQWVEIEGVVRRSRVGWLHLVMEVAQGNNRLDVRMAQFYDERPQPIHGRAGANSRGGGESARCAKKISGNCVFVSGPENLTVVRAPVAERVSVPQVLSTNLLTFCALGRI